MDFRKLTEALWTSSRDPSTYGELDLPWPTGRRGSPLVPLVHALAEALVKVPAANVKRRWGRWTPRSSVDLTIMVHLGSENLQYLTLRNLAGKTLEELNTIFNDRLESLRQGNREPQDLGLAAEWIRWLPGPLLRLGMKVYLSARSLGIPLGWLGLPSDPFGPVVITNIGSFGLQRALVPLVPIAKAPMFIAVGKVDQRLRRKNGEILEESFVPLGITFDHRALDGFHCGQMAQILKASFEKLS